MGQPPVCADPSLSLSWPPGWVRRLGSLLGAKGIQASGTGFEGGGVGLSTGCLETGSGGCWPGLGSAFAGRGGWARVCLWPVTGGWGWGLVCLWPVTGQHSQSEVLAPGGGGSGSPFLALWLRRADPLCVCSPAALAWDLESMG